MGLIKNWERAQERKLGLNESIFKPKSNIEVETAIDNMSTLQKERYVLTFFEDDWKKMIEALINGGIQQEYVLEAFLNEMDKDELEMIIDDILSQYLSVEEIAEVLAGADLGVNDEPVRKLINRLGESEKDEILSNIIRDYILKK